MSVAEQNKVALSDVVDAFSLVIMEVCQTMEHQRSMPVQSQAFASEFKLRAANLPDDSSGKLKKSILMNIANGLSGQPLAPVHFS